MSNQNKKALDERIKIKKIAKESTKIMMIKNEERGNCSGDIGLFGCFLEVRTMYLRLRSLVWDKGPPNSLILPIRTKKYNKWKADVKNALEDLRNYTILAEIALEDNNIKGDGDDSALERKQI